jgi:hypothetical protein
MDVASYDQAMIQTWGLVSNRWTRWRVGATTGVVCLTIVWVASVALVWAGFVPLGYLAVVLYDLGGVGIGTVALFVGIVVGTFLFAPMVIGYLIWFAIRWQPPGRRAIWVFVIYGLVFFVAATGTAVGALLF